MKNTIQQLASLYSKLNKEESRKGLMTFQHVHFQAIYGNLADMLGILITIEEIVNQNQFFVNHLNLYKRYFRNEVIDFTRMISKVMDEPENYGTDKTQAGRVQYLLQKLDGDIFDNNILKVCNSKC